MNDLSDHVEKSIRARLAPPGPHKVLVAVSGGLDSMVLLHLLAQLSSRLKWTLCVAHLDHQLRGSASRADVRRVRSFARRLDLPFCMERADVTGFARKEKLSLEMGARQMRHEFLARTAREQGCSLIALGHHADDQVETFILRVMRGSGLEGMAGMKWVSASPVDSSIQLIRPLLDLPKSVLHEYASGRKVAYGEDTTNAELDYQRNRVRNRLLPLLRRDYQPALDGCILRTMDILAADAEFIAAQARQWLAAKPGAPGRKRVSFGRLPVSLQRQCIRLQLLGFGHNPEYETVERLRLEPGREWALAADRVASRHLDGTVSVRPCAASPAFRDDCLQVPLDAAVGKVVFSGLRLRWRIEPMAAFARPKRNQAREIFDAEAVGPEVLLRHWQPGDRFYPIGGPGNVKLQDLFTNSRVPADQRRTRVIACSAAGEIFWVEGLRISERFKITGNSRNTLYWEWERA